jgi:hypothetical protein
VTNLDLALYAAATNTLLDSSTSVTDTVEQVQAPGASSQVVVGVGLVNIAGALGEEDFALATEEGFTPAVGPALADGSMDHVVPVGQARLVNLRVTNTGDLPAHGVVLTVTVPAGLGLPVGSDVYNIGVLDVGAVYTVPYTVTLQQDAPRLFGVTAASGSYGSTYVLSDTVGVYPQHNLQWLPLVPMP